MPPPPLFHHWGSGVLPALLSQTPGLSGMQASPSAPFCGAGVFVSWNARALFSYDPSLLHRKLDYLCSLAASADVVMIQEAHSNAEKPTVLHNRLRHTHVLFWCNAVDDSNVGGIGFVMKRSFLSMFDTCLFDPHGIVPARAALLSLRGPRGALDLCNLHLDPSMSVQERIAFLDTVRSALSDDMRVHTIVCGDFNSDSDFGDRLDCARGVFCGRPGAEQEHFDNIFKEYAELDCRDFTHRTGAQVVTMLSRIDRVYTSLPAALCQDFSFSASVMSPAVAPDFTLSDHVPLKFTMRPTTPATRRSVPSWVTRHPLWPITLDEILASFGAFDPQDHNHNVRMTKVAMRLAARRVIDISAHHKARNADEELWWLTRALRAIHRADHAALDRCLSVVPSLDSLLDTRPGDLAPLLRRISELSRRSAATKLQEVRTNASLPEYARRQQVSRLTRLLRTWAPSRRNVMLQGIRADDGSFVDDPSDVFDAVAGHWSPVFAEKVVDADAARTFIAQWSRPFPEAEWKLSYEDFVAMLSRTSDSGCGPDAVPYSAWRLAGAQVQRTLYAWYCAWLDGNQLGDDANHALLALIPKQADPADAAHGLHRHPKNLRPLSLSNTDVKLLAMALNAVASPLIPAWARPEQHGFIHDRLILQNVVDIESHALRAALRSSLSPGTPSTDQLVNPAAIFFDFGAAFPSLAQEFLWALLAHIGFPPPVLRALRELYRDNVHYWRFGGYTRPLFTVHSGVKQGCPFSTTLFVIVMDPFIAALSSSIGLSGCLRVYADDIALVLHSLVAQAPSVARLCILWLRIAALCIRHDKCVIVPLWTRDLLRARTVVMECLPYWSDFAVALAAKYLGFYIGPEAHTSEWTAAEAKYRDRVRNLLRVDEGITATMLLHNVQALPVLYYVAQLRDVPPPLLALQARFAELLTRGPWSWLPPDAAFYLDTLVGLPLAFHRLRDMELAIKLRTLSAGLSWRDHHRDLLALRHHDDQRVQPPALPWLARSAVATLDRADRAAASLLPQLPLPDLLRRGQLGAYRHIRAARGLPHLEHLLRERWASRWSSRFGSLGTIVRRACSCRDSHGSSLPPFLRFALINTWFNGWCTEHRFQGVGKCHFCGGPSDALEHLAGCIFLKALFRHFLGVCHLTFAEFLGLGMDRDRLQRQVLGLHAAKSAVEHRRFVSGSAAFSMAALFRAALQDSARKWPRARQLVSRWSLPPAALAHPPPVRGG